MAAGCRPKQKKKKKINNFDDALVLYKLFSPFTLSSESKWVFIITTQPSCIVSAVLFWCVSLFPTAYPSNQLWSISDFLSTVINSSWARGPEESRANEDILRRRLTNHRPHTRPSCAMRLLHWPVRLHFSSSFLSCSAFSSSHDLYATWQDIVVLKTFKNINLFEFTHILHSFEN